MAHDSPVSSTTRGFRVAELIHIGAKSPRFGKKTAIGPALLAFALVVAPGCHGVGSSRPLFREHVRGAVDKFTATHELSAPVDELLERQGLRELVWGDPAEVVRRLESTPPLESDATMHLAVAELSHRIGHTSRHHAPGVAMERFRDAAAASSAAMAGTQPDHNVLETARRLHNHAVADLLALVMAEAKRSQRPWTIVALEAGVQVVGTVDHLDPRRFSSIDPTSTYQISGMNNRYANDGLGVPLVALRPVDRDHPQEPIEALYPRRLHVAATAVMMPPGGPLRPDWRYQPASLMLHDPFVTRSIALGSRTVTIATDRTTPLAVQVAQGKLGQIAYLGLFQADRAEAGAGLYALRPYQPGKIPIVLIHGLFSSPEAWVQTINELQNDREIDAKYQIWFFLYPTGNVVPISAVTLRKDLNDAVARLDPNRSDPAMSRMVLVGHSMGGILARMMVQNSGTTLWDAILTIPYNQLQASAATAKLLNDALIYERLPYVSRVIFVATPHRGSRLGDELIGRLVSRFIQPDSELKSAVTELISRYGRDVVKPDVRLKRVSSIGNLGYHSPILMGIDSVPIVPGVPYHSIIPQIPGTDTDGVVRFSSSTLPGSVSEVLVPGTHVDQEKPVVTAEIKRILKEHVAGD